MDLLGRISRIGRSKAETARNTESEVHAEKFTVSDSQEFARTHDSLVEGIVKCARDAFGESMSTEEVVDHLIGDVSVLKGEGGDVIAFSITRESAPSDFFKDDNFPSTTSLYLAGAAVRGDHQGQGLYKRINVLRFEKLLELRSPILFTQTQNPNVEQGIVSGLEALKRDGHISDFSRIRIKRPGVYGRQLTQAKPKGADTHPAYTQLHYDAGDAYALLFAITYPSSPPTPTKELARAYHNRHMK